jgi:hypothetical protein
MKHARPDYNAIQDPRGIIPKDEPVFLLRGQDRIAPAVVRIWAHKAADLGAELRIVNAALEQADAMDDWQHTHSSKVPDMPKESPLP